jgi:hypothetical protein
MYQSLNLLQLFKVTIIQYEFKNYHVGTAAKCGIGTSYSLNTMVCNSVANTSCCKMSPQAGCSYYKKHFTSNTLSILKAL